MRLRTILAILLSPLMVIALVATPLCAALAADPYPTRAPRAYDRGADTNEGWGALTLSETFASFSKLRGTVQLQYVGPMPADVATTQVPGRVYRVLNADAFFAANKGTAEFGCARPIKYVGLLPGENQPDTALSIWLFAIEYADFRAASRDPGLCGLPFTYWLRGQ